MDDSTRPVASKLEVCGVAFKAWVRPEGVARLELPVLDTAVRAIEGTTNPRVLVDDAGLGAPESVHLHSLGMFLAEMLSGREPSTVCDVTLEGTSEFSLRILRAVRRVPWGLVSSYGEIAREAGAPSCARAVGGAVGRNPAPLLIPCHRILRADASIGGWSGTPGWKEWLLELEGSIPRVGARVRPRPACEQGSG